MTAEPTRPDRTPEPDDGTNQVAENGREHLRSSVVEAYRMAPRGERDATADSPGSWTPRWRPMIVALALMITLLAAGLLVRVDVETSAVVAEAEIGSGQVLLAPMQQSVPEVGTAVRVTDPANPAAVATSGVVRSFSEGVLVVEITAIDGTPGALTPGSTVTLWSGTTPLLRSLVTS